MFDGFKILNLIAENLFDNPLLTFPLPIHDKTAEVLNRPRIAKYNGLTFTHVNNNTRLTGSLHKYNNSGLHNYNDYNLPDLLHTLIDLWQKFNINPTKNELNNVEFGVNVITHYLFDVISKNIIHYKGKPFVPFDIDKANGIECKLSDFIIKIYDKGHQYNRLENIIRIEIKVIKMNFFERKGITLNKLADCLTIDFKALGDVLLSVWNEILFTDETIKNNGLTTKERLLFANGNNPKYWEKLKPDSDNFINRSQNPNYKKQRKKYYKELDNFKSLLNKYSTSTIQADISKLISEKWDLLTFADIQTRDKITDFLKQFETRKGDKVTDLKITEKGQSNILSIVSFCPPQQRYCLVCGMDITKRRFNCKFCSKKCKNTFTNPLLNPKNNLIRKIDKRMKQPHGLFDIQPFIKLSDRDKYLLSKHNSIYNTINFENNKKIQKYGIA